MKIFLTQSEVARLAHLPLSALKRHLVARGINPVAETAAGRIRLYPESIVDTIRKTPPAK
jgi:hypothetical protein